jgi:hypothetical protein
MRHVDGEDEQLAALAPQLRTAARELAKSYRSPTMPEARQCLHWLVREAFRAGYQHAHSRNTVKAPEER